jgi:pSer/pThr/pTyr-binding forkhead associated (FHA) protein
MDRPFVRVIQDHVLVNELPLVGPLRIGRREDNDLVLADESVSGHHGLIDRDEHGWRYTDLGSVNGSIVAAGPTLRAKQSVALIEDTQVLIGATVIDVRVETSHVGSTVTTAVIRKPAVAAPAARLIIVVGGARRTVTLPGPLALIGRAEECDVRIEDTSVSLRHAELRWEGAHWSLRDLNSTNGTRVGVLKITAPRPIANNTQILVGEADLLFVHDGIETGSVLDADCAFAALRRDNVLTRSQIRQAEGELASGRRQLGEILVAAGWVSPGQWVEALFEAEAPACEPGDSERVPWLRPALLVVALAAVLAAAWWTYLRD